MPIHAHLWAVFGDFDPLKVVRYLRDPKKALLIVKTRHLSYRALELLQRCDV